ncbi:MAG TPA: hypothetical protein VF277_07550, partial [Steroidobacteraceae bacterium]
SSRTTRSAVAQLATLLARHEYQVIAVPFRGCLHLKSGATQLDDDRMLVNPAWVDPATFAHHRCIEVHPDEPHAANALALPAGVIHPAHHPRTRQRMEAAGLRVQPLAMTELAKAEAGVTCCSLILRTG